jgi:hypothetical protein
MIKKKHYLFLLFYSIIYLNKIQCGDNNQNILYSITPNMINKQYPITIETSPKSPKGAEDPSSNNFLTKEQSGPCIAGCNFNCFVINQGFHWNKSFSLLIQRFN